MKIVVLISTDHLQKVDGGDDYWNKNIHPSTSDRLSWAPSSTGFVYELD